MYFQNNFGILSLMIKVKITKLDLKQVKHLAACIPQIQTLWISIIFMSNLYGITKSKNSVLTIW